MRKILKFNWLLILLAFNPLVNSQTNSDLEYLELFPENQSNDIASRIPSNNVLSEDNPVFESSIKKEIRESNEIEIFGLDLFSTSPTTFAPLDFSPAPLDYVLGPGDELLVKYFGSINIQEITKN